MNIISVNIVVGVLVALLLNITCPSRVLAANSPEKEARFAQKIKAEIAKLGSGPDARVDLKLRDKTKLKGYISEVGDQSFAVVDAKTGSATTVTYPQVKQVKGNNLSTGAKIAIGVSIAVAVFFIIGLTAGE
ncbi:MAG TPA: hypothetical protein VJ875_11400 [Pyrinomonadaceae bacterium]|nr:hypothetical protein [Pyrinomonadaceae bacterium]